MSALPMLSPGQPVAVMPRLEACPFRWLAFRLPDETDRLPTIEEEQALRLEVEAANQPIGLSDLEAAIGRMVASYPQAVKQDRRGYALALFEHVGDYAVDVVQAACHKIVRTNRFLPSVAEVVEICDDLSARRRTALASLDAVAGERERRRQKAVAERVERAKQDEARAEWREAEEKAMAALAEALPEWEPGRVWASLNRREEWAVKLAAAKSDRDLAEWVACFANNYVPSFDIRPLDQGEAPQ